jgi:hypothetical protein
MVVPVLDRGHSDSGAWVTRHPDPAELSKALLAGLLPVRRPRVTMIPQDLAGTRDEARRIERSGHTDLL